MNGNEFLDVNGKWTFNESTANVFEDMLQRSIPKYKSMREDIFKNLFLEKEKIGLFF